jgi:hypothetical protein
MACCGYHADFSPLSYGVWHARAVFHFLTAQEDRNAYVENAESSLKPGGHIIIRAFGSEGPENAAINHSTCAIPLYV